MYNVLVVVHSATGHTSVTVVESKTLEMAEITFNAIRDNKNINASGSVSMKAVRLYNPPEQK